MFLNSRKVLQDNYTGEPDHSKKSKVPTGIEDEKVRLFQEKIYFSFDEIYHILHYYYLLTDNGISKITDLVIIAKVIREVKKVCVTYKCK